MYSLNYTFLTELEVDTRQSYDDLSDDLLLLDRDSEKSQVLNMRGVISSWQNFFWKIDDKDNPNKKRLDITFTDISIYHKTPPSVNQDYNGNALNSKEMMTVEELDDFFGKINNWGQTSGRSWADLSNALCNALTTLQAKYTNKNNIYPVSSILVTDRNPNLLGFGTWVEKTNCYLSERFSSANYDLSGGMNHGKDSQGSGTISAVGLDPSTSKPPSHTHQLSYVPANGSGSGGGSGEACTPKFRYFNVRAGKSKSQYYSTLAGSQFVEYYSGKYDDEKWYYTFFVATDASVSPKGTGGSRSADFTVSNSKKDPVDKKIKVAPKTYPMSASIWEKTRN